MDRHAQLPRRAPREPVLSLFRIAARRGPGKSAHAEVQAVEIARAKDTTGTSDLQDILLVTDVTSTGYRLEAWFPVNSLYGFDMKHSPRLGFYAIIRDSELGDLPLTVGNEFPVDHDPSLWTTLELTADD